MKVSFKEAYEKGYRDCFFALGGLGDTIMFYAAVEAYYKATKKKLFICTHLGSLLENTDYCDWSDELDYFKIIADRNNPLSSWRNIKLNFVQADPEQKRSAPEGNGYLFYWMKQPIIQRMLSHLGVSGTIEVDPKVVLTDEEKKYGRFFQKKSDRYHVKWSVGV